MTFDAIAVTALVAIAALTGCDALDKRAVEGPTPVSSGQANPGFVMTCESVKGKMEGNKCVLPDSQGTMIPCLINKTLLCKDH